MKVRKSPNFNQRSGKVKYLILHYTGMATGIEALDRLCCEEAAVSAHYLIEQNGKVHSLVDENMRAWHAGVSRWEDDTDINDLSIGIELVNSGHSYSGYESEYTVFPEAQMVSLIALSKKIIARHDIKPCHIIGHSDVAWRRKIDPGELFDWKRMCEEGVGLWCPLSQNIKDNVINSDVFLEYLQAYGYEVEGCAGNISEITTAFQRHFRQSNIDGVLDAETMGIIENLLLQKFN